MRVPTSLKAAHVFGRAPCASSFRPSLRNMPSGSKPPLQDRCLGLKPRTEAVERALPAAGLDDLDALDGLADELEPRVGERRLARLQPLLRGSDARDDGRAHREDADARHPAPVIAAAPKYGHGALLSVSIPEVPLVRPARDAQPRQRVREQ